jgi:predicted nucleotidyltransferase
MELNIPRKYKKDIEKAVNLLKNEGCKSVYLFGSMVTGKIHQNSDIDIGVKGLPAENFFKVYSKLYMDLDNRVDLVDFDYDRGFPKTSVFGKATLNLPEKAGPGPLFPKLFPLGTKFPHQPGFGKSSIISFILCWKGLERL